MIKLGEYKQPNAEGVYGGWMDYETFSRTALDCARREYVNSGVKGAGWPGYIVVQTKTHTMSGWILVYYYKNEPRTFMAKYKIEKGELISL